MKIINTLLFKGDVDFASQGMEKKRCLSPGCIDLTPLHLNVGKAPQTETVDCAKVTIMPNKIQ